MIGKPMLTLKDVNGKEFNREMVDINGQGWVRFAWRNPLTNAMQLKAQYMVRVGEYVVGVGAYVDKPPG
jgi:cytochrome c